MKKLIILWVLVWGLANYLFVLPVLTLTVSSGLVFDLMVFFGVLAVICAVDEDSDSSATIAKISSAIAVLLVVGLIVGGFLGTELLQSSRYRNLIGSPKQDEFSSNVSPINPHQMILVDDSIARRLGEKVLGEDPALGSRCELGDFNLQIVKNDLYWIAPLEHSGFWKWRANDGTPGFVAVNATNEKDVRLVKEVNGKPLCIRYLPSGFFGEDLERHIYSNGYASVGITDYTFEVDDDWNPYWVVTTYDTRVFWAGHDATGVIVINPETGGIDSYSIEQAPKWIDRIHPVDFVMEQVDDWGTLVHGVFNWSNRDKLETIGDYTIVMGSDGKLYYYIGLCSVGKDESTVGFMMVDCRTKEPIWIHQAGATETAAKRSAEGIVQAQRLVASEGITYNIGGHATYEFLMKDKEGLMKKIALVSVQNYEDVAVGDDRQSAIRAYLMKVGKNRGNMVSEGVNLIEKTLEGRITRFGSEVNDGNTLYHLMIEGRDNQFIGDGVYSELCLSRVGDRVRIKFIEDDGEIHLESFDNLEIESAVSAGNVQLREKNQQIDSLRRESQKEKVLEDKFEKLTPEQKQELLEM